MVQHRLPIVNSDDGTWGDILRWYLSKEHYNNDTDDATNNGGHQNITIRPGTASAAPITFSSGTNLTTATAGAMEYDGSYYYLTTSSATRKKLAIYNDASGATGDTYYRDSSGNFTRLAAGSNGNILTLASGIPSWTASLVGMALNNTNTITVKDGNFTLQNSSDTTKQANFSLAGNTTGTTRTYTLPDVTDTLAAKGRDVDPLWQRGGNLVYDGSFNNTAAWANAFGTMTTAQAYNGTQSRQITATGAGTTIDRLTLTHDGIGNPISIELMPWAVTLGEMQIRKGASNTGSGNLYLRVRYKDSSGVEQLAASATVTEASLSSSAWTYCNNLTYTTATQATSYYFTLEIDPAVPAGNVYYIDQVDFTDIGLLSGWQGTTLTMQSLVIDNSNTATLKDGSFTLQNTSDTTKQAKFSLASNTASTTRTYTMPDANTTIVGTDVTQTLTNKTLTSPRINQILDTNGNLSLLVNPSASAVNYLIITNGATGVSPAITASGTDTNLSITMSPKGNGAVQIWANTQTQALIAAQGSNTNVNLEIAPKGTGRVTSGGVNIPTISSTDTLSNKTLSSPTFSGFVQGSVSLSGTNEGLSLISGASELIALGVASSASNWSNVASTNDGVIRAATNNLVISARNASGAIIFATGATDTEKARISNAGVFTVGGVQVADISSTQTFTNKTLTSPVISTISNTGTLTLPTSTDTLVGRATTDTLTNKRITPRVGTTASSATPAINTDTVDQFNITALATNITSMSASSDTPAGSLTGTPTDGQRLMLRIKDNGTARTITWGPKFLSSGSATLLTTTSANMTHHVGFIWDAAKSAWICIAVDAVGY